MFAIVGIIVVFGAVLGGDLMEPGNIKFLIQPAELIIIGGAAAGTVLIGNPLHVLKHLVGGMFQVFSGWQSAVWMHLSSINSSNSTSKCCITTQLSPFPR